MSPRGIPVRVLGCGLCALALLACGDSSNGGSTKPNVRLAVESAWELSMIGSFSAGNGNTFIAVRLTLDNQHTAAVAASPANFRLRTSDGLEVVAEAAATQLTDACPSDAFLAAGRSLSCNVAFEIGRALEPEALLYVGAADGQTEGEIIRTETAVASFQHCDRCNDLCVDLKSSDEHCGACHVSACDECVDGVPTCDAGAACYEGRCLDPSVASMLRSSTSLVSCTALCAAEQRVCVGLVPYYHGVQRPLVRYVCSLGDRVSDGLDCGAVPPQSLDGCQFEEILCACGTPGR